MVVVISGGIYPVIITVIQIGIYTRNPYLHPVFPGEFQALHINLHTDKEIVVHHGALADDCFDIAVVGK